jgi:hypothetical protein
MQKASSSVQYAAAIVFVVLLTVFIDHRYFSPKKPHLESIPSETQAAELLPKLTQMSLINVDLPLPPALATSQTQVLQVEQNPLPPRNKKSSEQAQQVQTSSDKQVLLQAHSMSKAIIEPNQFQITQKLNQLVSLKGIERTLYFPEANTRQVLAFMHNCVGIDIGAVKDNNLTLFSHKNSDHSQIVRAANGFKTPQENALLQAYAPNQILVRLYPKWFDERLGKEIASSLGTQKLTQLSGTYALRGDSLWLTEVNVNSKPTSRDWLLSRGC